MNPTTATSSPPAIPTRPRLSWQHWLPLGLTCGLPQLLRAENQVDYRYEYYDETGHRMKIETHSAYFEQKLIDAIVAKGELIYDGISGATPIGTHAWAFNPSTGSFKRGAPKLQTMWDLRRAANLELDTHIGSQTLTPGFAWSKEHDYLSYGVSLNDAIEFNDKNTILQLGASHNFDSVRQFPNEKIWRSKDSTDGIIGISQLLSPKDILDVAVTVGNDSGFMGDPYRSAEYLPAGFGFGVAVPERRPSQRNKEILFSSWTHHFDSLDASLEGSYRFYNDSFGVLAHTVTLAWHQRLGKHFIVEPLFRFSEQSAASFYTTGFSGPFVAALTPGGPGGMHSSDYRLSNFYSLDYGLQATVVLNEHVHLVAGYHRYEMRGLDNTDPAMYPKANIFTTGISILW